MAFRQIDFSGFSTLFYNICYKQGITEHEIDTFLVTVRIILESTAHGFHDRKTGFMSTFHQRIQIWEHAVTEVDRSPDIVGAATVHPWFSHGIVNIGGVDREARLENTVLDPSDEQLCLWGNTVETADITTLVCNTG